MEHGGEVGVQQKARAERQFQQKIYSEAMKSYQASNEFFNKVLQSLNENCAEYILHEGTDILFFPNLLMADNYIKMGMIGRETGERVGCVRQLEEGPRLCQ